MRTKIFLNEEKGTVVTVLFTKRGVFKGKAKCSPEDIFDPDIGEEISELRAELAYAKSKVRGFKKKAYSLERQAEHMTKLAMFAELKQEALEDDLAMLLESSEV